MRTLFIMGVFRSGTTLLSSALNAHKDIYVAWQPYWLFFKACRNKFFKEVEGQDFDAGLPMGIPLFTSESQIESFRRVLDLVRFNIEELDALISEIKSYLGSEEEQMNSGMKPLRLAQSLMDITPGTAGHVLIQFMEKLYALEGAKGEAVRKDRVVGIKEVFCEEFIEPILNTSALRPKVVHIIRDPRAVVASRNYGKYMEATGSRYPIGFIIRSWKRTVENYLLNKNKENYLMLRFEDLVSRPEEMLRQACNIIGVKFERNLLDMNSFKDDRGHKWQPNSSFNTKKAFDVSSLNRWKDVLATEEIEMVEYFCQSEMESMGYKISTRSFNVERINSYREDNSLFRDWLKKYDFGLKA